MLYISNLTLFKCELIIVWTCSSLITGINKCFNFWNEISFSHNSLKKLSGKSMEWQGTFKYSKFVNILQFAKYKKSSLSSGKPFYKIVLKLVLI